VPTEKFCVSVSARQFRISCSEARDSVRIKERPGLVGESYHAEFCGSEAAATIFGSHWTKHGSSPALRESGSVRKVKEGETTNDLFAFLTTESKGVAGARPLSRIARVPTDKPRNFLASVLLRKSSSIRSANGSMLFPHSPQGAWRVHAHIRAIIDLLILYPHIGVSTDDPMIRRLTTTPYPYLVFYEATDAEIIVHAVRHTARDPSGMPGSA
jgi:toxin ParE1/3/4